MPTLQEQIAERFLANLAKSKKIDSQKIEQLTVLLTSNKKVKAEEFIKIFSQPAGEDLK